MRLLSIDPGIVNLSYFYAEYTKEQKLIIIDWNTVKITENNTKKTKIDELIECMLIKLNELFDDNKQIDIVLIENQPALINGNMKTISVVIYTYFNMMRLQYGNVQQVSFFSATNKLKCKKAANIDKTTYKDRKKASIEIAKLYISELFPDKLEWFNKLKKQDDAADTLNQAIYYIEYNT